MNKKKVIGLDIGGTHIAAVVLYGNQVVKKMIFSTPKSGAELKPVLIEIVSKLSNNEIKNIGIGVAGIVSGAILKRAPNIPNSTALNFAKIFKKPFTVKVDNDARAFLRANLFYNKKTAKLPSLGFTIGTGIGRAYAKNGNVIKIKKFEYPEIWEKKYQNIKDNRSTKELAEYLSEKLSKIIKKYNPKIVYIGGGVIVGRGDKFIHLLEKLLSKSGMSTKIKTVSKNRVLGAIGSGLIFINK